MSEHGHGGGGHGGGGIILGPLAEAMNPMRPVEAGLNMHEETTKKILKAATGLGVVEDAIEKIPDPTESLLGGGGGGGHAPAVDHGDGHH